MKRLGRLRREPLEEASCLPWLARLLAGDAEAAAQDLDRGEPSIEELTRFASIHRMAPMLSRRTDHPSLRRAVPKTLRHQWQEAYVREWLANGALMQHLHRLQQAFSSTGRSFLLLKGPYLAERFYGDLAQRHFEDLDLLVPAGLAKTSLQWLQNELQSSGSTISHSLLPHLTHALSIHGTDVHVDLHWALRCHPSFHIDEAQIWETRQSFSFSELRDSVDVLSDEFALVLTLLEIFDDLSRLEYSAKGFVDAFVILREVDTAMNWPVFFSRRKVEGLCQITIDVLILVVELFHAHDLLPTLVAALDAEGPTSCRGRHIVLRPTSRLQGLWSYRLPLYDMPRSTALLHLAVTAPLRALLL